MSILLDALKRSESQRNLGSVPTLQTQAETSADQLQQPVAWPPVVLGVLAFGLMSWLGWAQFRYEEPSAGSAPVVESVSGENVAVESAKPASAEGEAKGVADASAVSKRRQNLLPKLDESAVAESSGSKQSRAGNNIRNYQAPEKEVTPKPSAEPTRENAIRQSELARVELNQAAAQEQDKSSEQEFEPEVISYWQVPESLREGLPDLRISVLVYAEQPENRFLLLNGERMREGERLDNGLKLEEIKRDRAIFVYRDYRFHLKS